MHFIEFARCLRHHAAAHFAVAAPLFIALLNFLFVGMQIKRYIASGAVYYISDSVESRGSRFYSFASYGKTVT